MSYPGKQWRLMKWKEMNPGPAEIMANYAGHPVVIHPSLIPPIQETKPGVVSDLKSRCERNFERKSGGG